MGAPGYAERLRREGLALCAVGSGASVALVALEPRSRRWPANTLVQVALAGAAMARLGRRAVREALAEAEEVAVGGEGSGEPTPLWLLGPIVAGLAVPFVLLPRTGLPGAQLAGWDAALRVAAGSAVAGALQAAVFAPLVTVEERARGRRYVRGPGSRLLGGTRLRFTPVAG